MVLGCTGRTEIDRGQELEANDSDHDNGEGEQEVGGELALRGITIVDLANGEKVAKTNFLSSKDDGVDVEVIKLLGDVGTSVVLEEVYDRLVHELGIGVARDSHAIRGANAGRTGDVVGEVVDESLVHCEGGASICLVLNDLWGITNETNATSVTHLDH